MPGPLEGLRVADFTQLAQGPFSTQILGDLGADIIKIEPIKGDWMRHWSMNNTWVNGVGVSFLTLNRNKRSIAIDLKQEKGREVALRIIGASDVLTENFRPGVMKRLGLDYEFLHEQFPELVYVASTGWGSTGPYLTRPGQDLLAQAVSGTSYLQGEEGGPPQATAVGVADFTAGFHIVIAALAGVFRRQQSGQGQRVDVDLLSSMMHLYIQEYAVYLNGGGDPVRSNSGIPNAYLGAPYGYFETADGYIAIPMNPIGKVAGLIGVEGYEGVTETQIMEGRDKIREDLARGFLKKTTDEWLDILLAEDIWCAKVQDFKDAENDPQIAENEMIVEWEHPDAGKVRTTGVPFRLTETPGGVFMPPPRLSEHADAILADVAGYSATEIDALHAEGTVA
ncbi:MAG: CoA transferase [Thermomicrobiales bacterium]|nr:CoA transferase [Thermomicrobiales bacterium]